MDLAYLSQIPAEEFAQRRQRVLDQMENNSIAVLFSACEQTRNNDCTYPFRQESNFWYLTGFNEPDSALVMIKKDNHSEVILFLRAKDPLMETWNGRRLGVENAPTQLNIDKAYTINDFRAYFSSFVKENHFDTLYVKAKQQTHAIEEAEFCRSFFANKQIIDLSHILDEMRLFKSRNEIALMQQAGQISALGHIRAMKETRPNRFEYEIASEMLHEFNRHGARYESYGSIVAGGNNACILHYTENDQPLKDGDLLLIDAGCEFAMYAGDISRTFPVNGKFTDAQRDVYNLVLDIQKYAIKHLVPGNCIQDVNNAIVRILVEGLVKLGIMQGDVDELIETEAYRQFYMHGLGHWLGLDVHDVGSYSKDCENGDRNSKRRDRPLEIGMVLTVEPGIYISENADVPEKYKGIGIRIEDNLLMTEYGNKVLTSAVPKEIEEIEALMQTA